MQQMKFSSLLRTQARCSILLIVSLGILLALFQAIWIASSMEKRINSAVITSMDMVSAFSTDAILSQEKIRAATVAKGLLQFEALQEVRIETGDGVVLAHEKREQVATAPFWLTYVIWDRPSTYERGLYVPGKDDPVGRIFVTVNLEYVMDANLFFVSQSVLMVLIGVCVLALGCSLLLYHSMTKPLLDVARRVRGIKFQSLVSERIPLPLGHETNEIGLLVNNFNKLIERNEIALAQSELQKKSLVKAEECYRSIFENAVEGIFQIGVDGVMLNANPAILRMFGYDSLEEVLGVPDISAALYADAHDRVFVRGQLLQQGRIEAHEISMKKKDGTLMRVFFSARLATDPENGKQFFEGFLQDVTRQREAEHEGKRYLNWLHTLVDSSKDFIYLKDENLHYMIVNKPHEKLLGASCEDILGKSDADFFSSDIAAQRRRSDQMALAKGHVSLEEQILDRTFHVIKQRVDLGDEKGAGVAAVIREVTEQKHVEAWREAKLKAEVASEAKSGVLTSVSHDVRTPLDAIKNMVNVLENSNLNEQQEQCVAILQKANSSLHTLVDDILDFSKSEAGHLKLEQSSFFVADVFQSLEDAWSPRMREKGLEHVFEISKGVPETLLGDAARLRQIMEHLLENAVKFTDKGSITVRAESAAEISPAALLFSVQDTGRGISEEHESLIFEEFFQVDSTGQGNTGKTPESYRDTNSEGSGLGLAISKNLVSLFGGELWVESTVGIGSTFYFTALFTQGENCDKMSAEQSQGNSVRGIPSCNVLLAEDNIHNQFLFAQYVKGTEVRLDMVETGLKAVESFSKKHYDMVLMDMQMPEMDGFEATARIRKLERKTGREKVPIIALSAYSQEEEINKSIHSGCDAFFNKPINKGDFLQALATYLGEAPPVLSGQGTYSEYVAQNQENSMLSNGLQVRIPRNREPLIKDYLDDLAKCVAEGRSRLEQNDFDFIRVMGHRYKGSGGGYGFGAITDMGAKLEIAAKQEETATIQDLFALIESYLNDVEIEYK